MKITSNRRDDLIRERDEYRKQREEVEQQVRKERESFHQAEDAVLGPVKDYIEYQLGHYSKLTFDVRVERGDWFGSDRGIQVQIRCNEHNKFNEDTALSWNFDVKLNKEGEVIKETGSWSGLQATTPAQIASLRQSVDCIEFLNDINWADVLDKQMPKYEDYFKTKELPSRESEFNNKIVEAELEDLIGSKDCVLVQNFESSGYRGNTIYVRIIKETPSQYVCNVLSKWDIERYRAGEGSIDNRYTQRVKKTNIQPIVKDGELVVEHLQ